MEKRKITRSEVKSALKSVVSGEGGYRSNPKCVYTTPTGEACCIVGHLLDELKVPRPIWSSWYNAEAFQRWREWVPPNVEFTSRATKLITTVQDVADTDPTDGGCWGRVVADALL